MPNSTDKDGSEQGGLSVESLKAWSDAMAKLATSMTAFVNAAPTIAQKAKPNADPVISAFNAMLKGLSAHPTDLFAVQAKAWSEWFALGSSFWAPAEERKPVISPERNDRRFKDEEWTSNPYFDSLKQCHLLAGKQLRAMVEAAGIEDPSEQSYAKLLTELFLNATAPTNFAGSNPVVVRKTLETGGKNLVSGFANLLADVSEGKGIVRRRAPDTFKLGENIAVTPGGVVYQNDLMQLIQYTPTTAKVQKRPMLYVPPLVNKYYMIDLQPKSSLIRWLVEQGHTVFLVSWVDPDEAHQHCELEDYVGRGVIEAMDVVTRATGEESIDLFGFCMGGTLIAMAEAVLAARGQISRVGTATLMGAMVDFSDMKEWSAFVNEAQIDVLDKRLSEKGYIDKVELQQLFSLMRANDLIWSSFVNHYLLDDEAAPSDLMFWFEDGSHIPRAFLVSYTKMLLLNNHLRDPGAVTLLGAALDLGKVTAPQFILGLKDDHVSAWTAVYEGAKYFGGPVRFVLGGSGHNAGIINPPAAGKHGYWLNEALADEADTWLEGAQKQEGSWWPFWSKWLQEQPGSTWVDARPVGCGVLEQIEKAPGSYVTQSATMPAPNSPNAG